MNENQMTEASRYLLALAEQNAQAYASLPNTRAIIVTGSAAEGLSDFYSDLDMIVYYDTLPSEEALLAACQQNQGEDRNLFVQRSDDGCAELYMLHGVQCQIGHTTITAWERDIAGVLEQLDVTSPNQKALSGMLDARPLYGEPLVRQWQAQIAQYPDTLAQAMVNHYLTFFPIWGLEKRFTTRDATIWFSELLVEIAHHILGSLAGLNRRYYSSFQFKRMHRFIEQMQITPANLATRLEAIFHTDSSSAATQVEELVQELVTLVDQHMPQIDTTRVRARIGWRDQPWKPLA